MEVNIDKLNIAISHVQLIAEGYDPITKSPAEADSILNNPEVIREMYFIGDVLEAIRKNDGFIGRKPTKSEKLEFPLDSLQNFQYQMDKPITRLVDQLNSTIDSVRYNKLSYKPISDWFKLNQYLVERYDENSGKNTFVASNKGSEIGIYTADRVSSRGVPYSVNLYSEKAQHYIVSNLEAILNGEVF